MTDHSIVYCKNALDACRSLLELFNHAFPVDEAESTYGRWSPTDVLIHLEGWIDYSCGKLAGTGSVPESEQAMTLDGINRMVWERGRGVDRKTAFLRCGGALDKYRDMLDLYSDSDLERTDFPTGFDWPLWKYILLDLIVHPAAHVIHHGINRGKFNLAREALQASGEYLSEFDREGDAGFNVLECASEPERFRALCASFLASCGDDELVRTFVFAHNGPLVKTLKRSFDKSFSMITALIERSPGSVWNEKGGGFYWWQQLLHALCGTDYWLRLDGDNFVEPFAERVVYPELDGEPEAMLSRSELTEYARSVRRKADAYFAARDDGWLLRPCPFYGKLTRADVVSMQVRHLMYHAGHCECILRDRGLPADLWID